SPGRQLPRRRHRGPVRAQLPAAGRPARADGPRRPVPERVRARPDRGRQAAGRVRRAAGTEPGEAGRVPPHPRVRPAADHRRADRRAVRRGQRPRVAQGHGVHGRLVLQPGQLRGRPAGRAEGDPPRPAARVRRLRPLGAAGEVRRVQPAGHRIPGGLMISSLGYLRFESADVAAWREFGVKILGMTEGRGPEEGALYLRMDEMPARLVIVPGSSERLLASGWEVADAAALAAVGRALADAGVPYKAASDAELAARRVGAMLTLEDPDGQPLEVFCGAAL